MAGENKTSRPQSGRWQAWQKKAAGMLAALWSLLHRGRKWLLRVLTELTKRLAGRRASAAAALARVRQRARSNRGERFPESEYGVVCLFLFIWGNLPQAGSRLRERLLRRRKRSAHGHGRVQNWLDGLQQQPVFFLGGAMAVAAIAVAISLYTVGTAVTYDGAELGVVSGGRTVTRAVSEVEQITRETIGAERYTVDTTRMETHRRLVARKELETADALRERLTDALGLIGYGYVLYVDGAPVAATTFSGALEDLLEQMKIGYITKNTVECDFEEDVEIRRQYIGRGYMMNLGYIAERLTESKADRVTHTVAEGDTYEGIADAYNLTVSQLLEMNPGYHVDALHSGDVLTVAEAEPYLTLVDVERQSYVQDVPYDIVYEDDPDMYQGDYEVVSAGVYGKADITANVTYVNGEEQRRQTVARAMLIQPKTEIQRRGTKERPSWFPTGEFHWPCSGVITSYFGYRNTGIAGASTYHEALDIANDYGVPIYASDGGTVVYSGWMSGTGYTVKIDHGNGFVTLYGHNDSLLVDVGDHVYQGQMISLMGSTGISSGPHCHFSIIVDGTYVDPLNYLE